MKRFLQIFALLIFASISVLAQEAVDQKIVAEKYDEISRLESSSERRQFLGKQTEEMKVALWHENVDRKTSGVELSAEQKEIIAVIKNKFMTVELAQSAKGKREADAGQEYNETMAKASQLLGKENMRDWFGILGDSKTLKK